MNARCSGVRSSPRPSTVVISAPSAATASVRHDRTRRPSRSTVQAPHCPWSHPFFGPVRPIPSRTASSSVVRLSTVNRCVISLTWSEISVLPVTRPCNQPGSPAGEPKAGELLPDPAAIAKLAVYVQDMLYDSEGDHHGPDVGGREHRPRDRLVRAGWRARAGGGERRPPGRRDAARPQD